MKAMRKKLGLNRNRGIIIVITLFGLFLIAGVFGYILNLGHGVNRRVVTQHGADASVRAGAGWVARSFNTVAMNNVSMTRLIAGVPVFDAMPKATDFSLRDQTAYHEEVSNQLSRGIPAPDSQILTDRLRQLEQELAEEIEILTPMDQYLNHSGFDMSQLTHYRSGDGEFWQAIDAMDHYNQALMTNLGATAQVNAVRGGQVNLATRSDQGWSVMVPVVAEVPWQRGRFNDFERPVRFGLLPGADDRLSSGNRPDPAGLGQVDEVEFNRGPWDTVFGWRFPIAGERHGYWVPGDTQVSTGGSGSVPIGSGAGGGGDSGRFVTTHRDPDEYGVRGEFSQLRRRVSSFRHNHLPHSRFSSHVGQISNFKLRYVWPGRDEPFLVREPEWVVGLEEAVQIAEDPEQRNDIAETAFVVSELKSAYPMDSPNFLAPGTWSFTTGNDPNPYITRRSGWLDPREWDQMPPVTKITDHIWRDEWEYQVAYDHHIGLAPQLDAQGNIIPQTVYRIDHFVFLAVNVGERIEVSDPFAGLDPGSAASPAPVDFDHEQMDRDEQTRWQHLTYFSAARLQDHPVMWGSRFTGRKLDSDSDGRDGSLMAIAQAEVFNNHSWDLWTQMWHAQLQRIEPASFTAWVQRMGADGARVGEVPVIVPEHYERMYDYLGRIAPLADDMLKH